MKRFEPGVTYKTRSICDADCIIAVKVISRTAKTIIASVGHGGAGRFRVSEREGVEFIKPWGSYSMAPTICATDAESVPAVTVTYTAPGYSPEAVRARYVRADVKGGGYSWCEVGADPRYDIRQGTIIADALPPLVRQAADALRGTFPGYVRWSDEDGQQTAI